ncbi:MAG: hypothetical protein Q8P23_04530 [bacterium]|nr:hypothetical protein [bacterium]MDZ4341831.1 hypothetical protein [Candidatus Binatia bacterium]
MTALAIRVENLGKQYRIGQRERYKTLRDVLVRSLTAPFRALGSAFRNSQSAIGNSFVL